MLYPAYGYRADMNRMKKPFNPILGEQFFGACTDPDDPTNVSSLISEQGSSMALLNEHTASSLNKANCRS